MFHSKYQTHMNKTIFLKKIIPLSLLFCIMFTNSCTDLSEEVLDESLSGGATAEEQAAGSLAPAYAVLPGLFQHTNYFTLQEISTDEAILPYRGGTDWGDNGIFIDMHRHTFTSSHIRIRDAWNAIVSGVTRSVVAITALTPMEDPNAQLYLAEARALRAYYSLLSLDLFGLVFVKDDLDQTSTILRGNDAVEFIKNELLAVVDQVSTSTGPGRITRGGVYGLLARLHLNAPVYRDPYADAFDFTTADMDAVIDYCNNVIALGQYQLSPEYFEIFDDENHDNKELIFAIDQRADLNGHNRMAYFSLSGDQYPLPEFPNANGTDGAAITSDFYQTWVQAYGSEDQVTNDPRFHKQNLSIYSNPADSCVSGSAFEINRGILRGQQYGLLHSAHGLPFERCQDGVNYKVGKLFNITRANKTLPVIFTENIDFTEAGSGYSNGYRVEKYEFSKKSDTGRNKGEADIVILRLADIYLMRAEAKLRKSDAAGALQDVNTVRASRTARALPPPPLDELNLDILYRERGFEFYWEMLRRTDMIRFGKYEDTWTEKTNTDKTRRLFPIPQTAIDGASNIPGYLNQNLGY
jgi:starch-binding outer membrane protein, SusD/RagB family